MCPINASQLRGNFTNSHFCPGGNWRSFRGAKFSKSNISLQYNILHLRMFFLLHREPSLTCHWQYKQIILPNTKFSFDLPPGSNQLWNIFAGRVNDQKFHNQTPMKSIRPLSIITGMTSNRPPWNILDPSSYMERYWADSTLLSWGWSPSDPY